MNITFTTELPIEAIDNGYYTNDLSARGIYAKLAHQAISQANTLIAGV